MIWKKLVFSLVGIGLLAGCSVETDDLAGSRPNVVLIMADDLGFDDLGVHGNSLIETPTLDKLAGESLQFRNFYVTPVCATTRASLLTGRHFLRTGVSHVHGGKDFLHRGERTLAESLRELGYATGMWGKWHSGKTPGYFPWERGFDEAFMARLYRYRDNVGLMNGDTLRTTGWITGVLTDFAIDFISRNREKPFFAYLPYLTCHSPLEAPEIFTEKYKQKGLSENLSTLYGMVDHMDYHIDRLLNSLDSLGLSENTLVLFLSDNGPAIINNYLTDEDRKTRYVNGFRGHKGNLWENGIKSPLFIRWTGRLEAGSIMQTSDVCDLFPTLLELAGGDPAKNPNPLDGFSLLPCLENPDATLPGKVTYLYGNPGWPPTELAWTPEGVKDEYRPWKYAEGEYLDYKNQILTIRKGQYKLLLNPGDTDGTILPNSSGYVLVDLEKDPQERENLAEMDREIFEEMRLDLETWYHQVLEEEHAFEMPEFEISQGSPVSRVLAYAPRQLSEGVKNASGFIGHFEVAGQQAIYDVRVETPGEYKVEIVYKNEGEDHEFQLSLGEKSHRVSFQGGGSRVTIPGVELGNGPGQLTLTNQTEQPGSKLRLFEILFYKNTQL